jgi:hypothetical protein
MWTTTQIAELRKLRAAGHSASQIAATLGMSRNAVLAMAWRLKLPASTPSASLRQAHTARATYATLLTELKADPALLREIHAVLRESGYGTFQIGEAAEMQDGFVAIWRIARQRRQAAGG